MDDKQSPLQKLKRTPEGRDPKFPLRVVLIWVIILTVVPAAMWLNQRRQEDVRQIPFGELQKKVEDGVVRNVEVLASQGGLDTIRAELDTTDKTGEKTTT